MSMINSSMVDGGYMITDKLKQDEYYKALLEKDSQYEGVFFAGIKTTGIFCRPTCHARKPLKENCDFFGTAQEALLAGFRPCKKCKPLEIPSVISPEIKQLIQMVEKHPEKKWKDRDFDELDISANTARRQFKKYFGMTFIEYSRSRRLGIAFNEIRNGHSIISAQLDSGFESANGFRDAFSNIMGELPTNSMDITLLYSSWIETKLGSMLAITDKEQLYLLEFVDRRGLENEIVRLRKRLKAIILPEKQPIIDQLESELTDYFDDGIFNFQTPVHLIGSDFQQKVWLELQRIPLGETLSYKELAINIGNDKASRAVARANGANQIAILIPCHRVINSNGELGGYGGGVSRKQWLLQHEGAI